MTILRLRRVMIGAITVFALIAALAGCGQTQAPTTADGKTKVRVATTVVQPPYWPFYYTPELLGFYAEEGLEVQVVPINAGVTQMLLANKIDIGGAGFDYMQQASNVSGMRWYMMTDRHVFAPMVLDSSPIRSVADLRGKRIGINESNDSFDADFVLASNGVPLNDYELVPIGEAAPAAKALEAGQVDAIIIPQSSSKLQAMDAIKEKLRLIETPSSKNFYNTGLMATEGYLKQNRETAIKFGRAVAKAIIWMNENPEATAEMVMQLEPDSAADKEEAVRKVKVAVEWNSEIYAQQGKIKPAVFAAEVDALMKSKLIDKPYDPSTVYDESLYDEIWNFDVDAVKKQAREGNWRR